MDHKATSNIGCHYRKFKPHLLMILAQIGYTFLYFITEASFNHGMNPHVYVTYRHIVSGLVMLPFAYFLERKLRPKLTLALFLGNFYSFTYGDGFDSKHIFCKLEVHISNLCSFNDQHHSFPNFHNCNCAN